MILLCFINNSNYRRVNKMSTYMSMRNILTKHFEKKKLLQDRGWSIPFPTHSRANFTNFDL